MRTVLLLLTLVLIAACGNAPPATVEAGATYEAFGAALSPEAAVPVQAVVHERAAYVGRAVKIEGRIAEVCQMAGCWVTLQAEGANIRVHVPRDAEGNYGFTLPKDASGRRAVVEGVLTEATPTEAEAHHYAEDGAAPAPTGLNLQVAATGVLLEKSKT